MPGDLGCDGGGMGSLAAACTFCMRLLLQGVAPCGPWSESHAGAGAATSLCVAPMASYPLRPKSMVTSSPGLQGSLCIMNIESDFYHGAFSKCLGFGKFLVSMSDSVVPSAALYRVPSYAGYCAQEDLVPALFCHFHHSHCRQT